MQKEVFTLRLSIDTILFIKQSAKEQGITASALVCRILEDYQKDPTQVKPIRLNLFDEGWK